jgi:hypothetical protein
MKVKLVFGSQSLHHNGVNVIRSPEQRNYVHKNARSSRGALVCSRVVNLSEKGGGGLFHLRIAQVLCVQNGSGAHPTSYPMGIRGSFPRRQAARA